jgi:Cof subfamily protein (haloacid dehalogenase superfamily)
VTDSGFDRPGSYVRPADQNRRVRLLASDVDGTLVRSDGTVSPATVAALHRATAAGLLVAFVTGRPPRWLHQLADDTGHTGVAVAGNGAVLYDLSSETILSGHPLGPARLASLTAVLRNAFPDVRFGVEYGMSFAYEPGYHHDWQINPSRDRQGRPIPPPQVAELAEIIARPALKLLAKDWAADADKFLAEAARVVGDQATVTTSSHNGLLEIAAPGVTKASGLAELAASHGITADEVVAVGDMPNDVAMLEWVGRAYAVANAHPSVLAVADEVLPSNDDDGVASLIDKLLGN